MRACGRPAEHLVQPPLDDVGHGVLQTRRLGVGCHPVEAEPVRQPALHDPVATHDRFRRAHAGGGQLDLLTAVHPDQTIASHPAEAYGDGRAADAEPVREPSAAQRLVLGPHVVDGLQVAGGVNAADVDYAPSEVLADLRNALFRVRVIAANEHVRRAAGELRFVEKRIAGSVERFDDLRVGHPALNALA